MSAGIKAAEKSGKKAPCTPSLSLAENLNAQRRKLNRVMVIVEDAGLGKESLLVPVRPDGEIDQPRLAAVLNGAANMLGEIKVALDGIVAEAGEGRGAS